jgi:hypothetical protein
MYDTMNLSTYRNVPDTPTVMQRCRKLLGRDAIIHFCHDRDDKLSPRGCVATGVMGFNLQSTRTHFQRLQIVEQIVWVAHKRALPAMPTPQTALLCKWVGKGSGVPGLRGYRVGNAKRNARNKPQACHFVLQFK